MPAELGKQAHVLNFGFLEANPLLSLLLQTLCQLIRWIFFLINGVIPQKVTIEFVNLITDRDGELHSVHSVARRGGSHKLNQGSSTSNGKGIGFLPS